MQEVSDWIARQRYNSQRSKDNLNHSTGYPYPCCQSYILAHGEFSVAGEEDEKSEDGENDVAEL